MCDTASGTDYALPAPCVCAWPARPTVTQPRRPPHTQDPLDPGVPCPLVSVSAAAPSEGLSPSVWCACLSQRHSSHSHRHHRHLLQSHCRQHCHQDFLRLLLHVVVVVVVSFVVVVAVVLMFLLSLGDHDVVTAVGWPMVLEVEAL